MLKVRGVNATFILLLCFLSDFFPDRKPGKRESPVCRSLFRSLV